ncbi:hypothetical protein HYH03_008194 [Edaphochlamys debaryana]|uniref:Uncharacterized protein n=1 Tax=Edaphochlamys debaryana TaxID=47281 RepID=A0A835Y0T3_9CHLO|nr:hypothetical protein HYH03_008194 [Edaphochlamys debaryana]|eukprot:KAG2493680.1 hypothetical protein HYH03_008194 [Edaphochlamys debaryana]
MPTWPQQPPPTPPQPPWIPDVPSPPPSPPPMYCPSMPGYPGISQLQVLTCDCESPQPDICSLSLLNGEIELRPGQTLAVEFTNINSSLANLNRIVLSAEKIAFAQDQSWDRSERMFLASGLCTDIATATKCLHDWYHGVPAWRSEQGCQRCFGLNLVQDLASPDDPAGQPWEGLVEGVGDMSLFRAQLVERWSAAVREAAAQAENQVFNDFWPSQPPLDGSNETAQAERFAEFERLKDEAISAAVGQPSVVFFLASLGSGPIRLNYARSARLLYVPGSLAQFAPPSNLSFVNITAPPNATAAPSANGTVQLNKTGTADDGSNATGPLTDIRAIDSNRSEEADAGPQGSQPPPAPVGSPPGAAGRPLPAAWAVLLTAGALVLSGPALASAGWR